MRENKGERPQRDAAHNYEMLPDAESRKKLLQRASELCDDLYNQEITTVFFLDKSARPLAFLMRKLWAAQKKNKPFPEIRFLNIGSRNNNDISRFSNISDSALYELYLTEMLIKGWISRKFTDVKEEHSHADYNKILDESIYLDNIFPDEIYKSAKQQIKIKGNKIAVIDDFFNSGTSLLSSMNLIAKSFPDVEIQGATFFQAKSNEQDHKLMPWLFGTQGNLEVADAKFRTNRLFSYPVNKGYHSAIEKSIPKVDESINEPVYSMEELGYVFFEQIRNKTKSISGFVSNIDGIDNKYQVLLQRCFPNLYMFTPLNHFYYLLSRDYKKTPDVFLFWLAKCKKELETHLSELDLSLFDAKTRDSGIYNQGIIIKLRKKIQEYQTYYEELINTHIPAWELYIKRMIAKYDADVRRKYDANKLDLLTDDEIKSQRASNDKLRAEIENMVDDYVKMAA